MTAFELARFCYSTLMRYGRLAKLACEQHQVTPALEHVIEANTLLSGLGFESGGLAAAHAIHNGLTVLPATHKYWHGEKVAFCTLVQLVLENTPKDTLKSYYEFLEALELPTTLSDLGMKEVDEEALMHVCLEAVKEGSTTLNMPFEVTSKNLLKAIIKADQYGQKWKTSGK